MRRQTTYSRLSNQSTLLALMILSTTTIAKADLSTEEKGQRNDQLKYFSRIVDLEGVRESEKHAILGMLILREDASQRTSSCYHGNAHKSDDAFLNHLLECLRCRKVLDLVRFGSNAQIDHLSARPSQKAANLLHYAEDLVDDGHGYIRPADQLGKRLPRSVRLVEEALRDSPDYPQALQLLGALKEIEGDSAAAELALKKAINLDLSVPSGLNNFALLQMRHRMYEHAHVVLRYAMERNCSYRTARLLAWLHEIPMEQPTKRPIRKFRRAPKLISTQEARELMKWVVREEISNEQLRHDRKYLRRLEHAACPPWRRG